MEIKRSEPNEKGKRSPEKVNTMTKPTCKLTGTNGNVFALAGRVGQTLKRAGLRDEAKEFYTKLPKCGSYDEALQLMAEYVDVH